MSKHLIKIVFIILFSVAAVFPQSSGIDYEKLSQRYIICHEEDGILKLQDKHTGKITYRTENIKSIPSDTDFDLIVDLRTIDTTQYSNLFTFWSEVPPYYEGPPLIIADANGDGRKDVYGAYRNSPDGFPVIYEINSNGSYDSIYQYPDTLGWPWSIGDLEKDGDLEIVSSYISYNPLSHYIKILSMNPFIEYPTLLKNVYQPSTGTGQPVDMTLYDMDGDGYPEIIYYLDGSGDSLVLSNSFQIAEYDRMKNQFNLIYQNRPSIYTPHTGGFAFGDFDSDGKQNFAVSNYLGEVFVYEHINKNYYNVIRIDSLPISNVYLQHFTEDLDNNGKPELWIGGEGYVNGVGSTILYIYEAYGNDRYEIVYSIAIMGVISFFASNCISADIDNDGKNEVLLCIDQHLLIFKNNKEKSYELFYIKRNETLNQNSRYLSATASDFDGDSYPEIVISMDLIENNIYKGFSRIYKKTSTIDVSDEKPRINSYYLSEAYPNPFNPSTSIKFNIAKEEIVVIKVYNLQGREIRTLLNKYLTSGEHQLTWDGTDNSGMKVSSGTYFINMVSGTFSKSIKALLIK